MLRVLRHYQVHLWQLQQLKNRPPVVINHEELTIFQQCFLSLYSEGYNETIDPLLIYQYQLLNFFQKKSLDLLKDIGEISNPTIRVSDLSFAAVGFDEVRSSLGHLPDGLDQNRRIRDWEVFASWSPK